MDTRYNKTAYYNRNKRLSDSTQLTRMASSTLSGYTIENKSDLDKIIRDAYKETYDRFSDIKKSRPARGEEISSSYNEIFRRTMGKGYKSAIRKYEASIRGLSANDQLKQMKSTASYLKRHLESELSSVSGIEAMRIRQLEPLALGGTIERVDTRGRYAKHGYNISGTFYSDEDLNKFFKAFHKACEETYTTRGASDAALNKIVSQMSIDPDNFRIGNVDAMIEIINNSYEEAQREVAAKAAAYEASLESVKFKHNNR